MRPMTLQEIAVELGVSRQMVMLIIQSALKKIRQRLSAKGIYSYSDVSIHELHSFALERFEEEE